MKTLISILGPTAVGKTSFALKLAKQALELGSFVGADFGDGNLKNETSNSSLAETQFTGVDLISADSRQIYKGLEILSGADVPDNLPSAIRLHGVSILDLTDEWSVAHFKNFAIKIIKNSFANNRLPIIVGGTNLYIKHLFNLDENLYVSPISEVRDKAKNMQVKELQSWLGSVNPGKLASMNNSDINNPRRLVRAIEISVGEPETDKVLNLPKGVKNVKIGLTADSDKDVNLDKILERIEKRVIERFENGSVGEVKKLNEVCAQNSLGLERTSSLAKSVSAQKSLTACSTLGASDITAYLNKETSQEKCLEDWALHEFQYAKRQLIWLKKEKDVIWLDDLAKSSYTLGSKLFDKQNEKISI